MKNVTRKTIGILTIGMAASAIFHAEEARSDTVGGDSGHGWPNSALSCFQGANSAKVNSCAGSRALLIQMERRNTGLHTFTIRAKGAGGTSATACRVKVIDTTNASFDTGTVSTTSTSYVALPALTQTVFDGETMFADCFVPQNGGVLSVNW